MKSAGSLAVFALSSSLASCTIPSPGAGYTTTLFSDDFNGAKGAGPSTSSWIYDMGHSYPGADAPADWGTGEIEDYTNSASNIQQNGKGGLQIIPRKSSSGDWTSARIETVQTDFEAPKGGKMKVQASIKLPNVTPSDGLGYWPAFWMLGGAFRGNYSNWPMIGEIDIMETINGAAYINQGIHCGVDPNGPCNEPDGLGQDDSCGGSTCVGGFHTYTAVVDRSTSPETITFYIDNVVMHTISESTLGTSTWNETFHHGYYLLLNVAIGGSYPNAVSGTTTPTSATIANAPMVVDYVAVWTT